MHEEGDEQVIRRRCHSRVITLSPRSVSAAFSLSLSPLILSLFFFFFFLSPSLSLARAREKPLPLARRWSRAVSVQDRRRRVIGSRVSHAAYTHEAPRVSRVSRETGGRERDRRWPRVGRARRFKLD